MNTEVRKRIWGVEYFEIYSDDVLIWKLYIREPFFNNGKQWIGINIKLIQEAQKHGVNKFMCVWGDRTVMLDVPSDKILKQKIKLKKFQDIPSKFVGCQPMRIFNFQLTK